MNKPFIKINYYESEYPHMKHMINKRSPNKCFILINTYAIVPEQFHIYRSIKNQILKL